MCHVAGRSGSPSLAGGGGWPSTPWSHTPRGVSTRRTETCPEIADTQNYPETVFGKSGRIEARTEWEEYAVANTSTVTEITAAERERRVAEAIHSGEMEGLSVSPAGRQDAQEYIAGRISSDELVNRARSRYGLD